MDMVLAIMSTSRDVVVPVPEGGGFGHDKSPLHPLSRNPPVRNTVRAAAPASFCRSWAFPYDCPMCSTLAH
eukprot:1161130-Pelagomonas_calceolata.AAC.2